MISSVSETRSECGCGPMPKYPGEGCCDCRPKDALTVEEEAILKKLRSLKTQARSLISKLKDIEDHRFDKMESESVSMEGDWLKISNELDSLRNMWGEWEKRLDDAIEQKWIMLGHREPRI